MNRHINAAINRIVKTNGGGAWIMRDGKQCICNGYVALVLNTPIDGLISREPINIENTLKMVSGNIPAGNIALIVSSAQEQAKRNKQNGNNDAVSVGRTNLNPRYLLDVLTVLGEEARISIPPNGELSIPALIESEHGKAIILPIRVLTEEEKLEAEQQREQWEAKRDAEEATRQAHEESEKAKQREKIAAALDNAEQEILGCRGFTNVELYPPEYNSWSGEGAKSLVLELMRRHGINVPIRTQGWIIKALHQITFSGEDISYTYNGGKNGSRDSAVFINYLRQLDIAVKVAHGQAVPKPPVEQQPEIPRLNFKPLERFPEKAELHKTLNRTEVYAPSDEVMRSVYTIMYAACRDKSRVSSSTENAMVLARLDKKDWTGNRAYLSAFSDSGFVQIKAYFRLINGEHTVIFVKHSEKRSKQHTAQIKLQMLCEALL